MLDLDTSRRHIVFNSVSDSYHDLVMAGNTPLIFPSPKKSSVEVPYSNGNIDTSEIDGTLYFENLTVSYNMVCMIPKFYNDVARDDDTMNKLCADKIEAIEEWVYSGPATLVDYGMPRDLLNADCKSISVNKTCGADEWVLQFTITFDADYNIPAYLPDIIGYSRNGRFIVYNGYTSYGIGLDMVGATPVTTKSPKYKTYDWKHKNGYLNLTHGRDGKTSGIDSEFFGNQSVEYRFFRKFSCYTNQGARINPCTMNQTLQEFAEKVCMWLYKHSTQPFTTIDGQITYGGTDLMLMDSAWIVGPIPSSGPAYCGFLPSARVASLNINKSIHNDFWSLTFVVRFETYPKFFYGYLTLPTQQTPTPVINYTVWKHYAEVKVNDRDNKIHMIEYDDTFEMGEGIYLSKDSIDLTHLYVRTTDTIEDQRFTMSGPTITAQLSIDVPEFIHESISDDESPYVLMLTLPEYIELTCGSKTLKYISYFASGTNVQLVNRKLKLFPTSIESSVQTFSCTALVKEFTRTITLYLLAVSETGIVGNDYFTPTEFDQAYPSLSIPMQAHYIQRITGDDILTDYGLWGEYDEYVPESYDILKACNLNYTAEEMPEYDSDEIIPYNVYEVGDPVKFKNPAYYYGTGIDIQLQIPVINENPNNYILCDSARPEGGDIQWL